jgi:diketogulonate reductase-like aldo/keto reductase
MTPPTNQPVVRLNDEVAIPLVGFGTWQLAGQQAYDATRVALDVGYRHIDTATMYRNEADIGRAIKDSGVPREDIFIVTKLPPERANRVRATLLDSLRMLDVEQVDLWLIHWPPNGSASQDIWRELLDLRDAGLTRAVGVSNYDLSQLDALRKATGEAPVLNQISWSPASFNAGVLAGHRERGVVLEGYSPLKRSNLRDPVLADIAAAKGVTPAQVVLRWHVDRGIPVIPRSHRPERIAANFDVFGFALNSEEIDRLDRLGG